MKIRQNKSYVLKFYMYIFVTLYDEVLVNILLNIIIKNKNSLIVFYIVSIIYK